MGGAYYDKQVFPSPAEVGIAAEPTVGLFWSRDLNRSPDRAIRLVLRARLSVSICIRQYTVSPASYFAS